MVNQYFANKMKDVIYTLYHSGAISKEEFERYLAKYDKLLT